MCSRGQPVLLRLLRDCALEHFQFITTKTKPRLPTTLSPLRIQKRPQRLLLRRIERPAMHRHIRMQHPTNDISQSRTTRSKVKHAQTHLASFSSRSASHASPSLSGTYSIGATSSRTSTASNPCALNACSVAGAVSVALGSTTSATCELGWTVVVVPALGSAVRIEEKGSFAPHGYV